MEPSAQQTGVAMVEVRVKEELERRRSKVGEEMRHSQRVGSP